MKGRFLAVAVLAALIADAQAADIIGKVAGAVPSAPQLHDWSGFYLGAHIGYAAGSSNWSASSTGAASTPLTSSIDFYNPYNFFTGAGSYLLGLQAGYNYMPTQRYLLGIEADVSFPDTVGGTSLLVSSAVGVAGYGERLEMSGTLRARFGYVPEFGNGSWLFYVTGGFAWSYDQFTRMQVAGVPAGGTAVPGTVESRFMTRRLGGAAGAGVEVALTPQWSARFEYLFADYASRSVSFPIGGQRFDNNALVLQTLRAGLDYRLGDANSAGLDVLTRAPDALELERFALHGQMSFVEQYVAPFHAAYHGQNSLDSNQGREAWGSDFYAGAKLWDGAEFWINPEIDQGFGPSDSVGVAGYPGGAAFKVGASVPYARIQRTFLRQTIDLGGDAQKVDSDQMQFASATTANRLVVTVGKYAPTDIFDQNKYATNPRQDFMNWALIDTGTFDYAGDAWGFTYGAAAEWYLGNLALRGGVFDLAVAPGINDLDSSFTQFQWIAEVECSWNLQSHPGQITFTGFLDRARLGTYQDAIALAQAAGTAANLAPVRQYRSRGGLGVNIEQEITDDLGVFMRAGFADGNIEPAVYTDIDRTVAAGFQLTGEKWGRPDDTLGLAAVVNGISAAHEAFFNAGGIGIEIGDGMLPHPGLEQIIETYYAFPVYAARVAFDYQFVRNPGYNRDRGPASLIAFRLTSDF